MTNAPFQWWDDRLPRPAWQQMAIDRALTGIASRDGMATYRLYRWAEHSISFGANEAATRTWDRERLERLKLPTVRRPTGGRGVWHDADDLTYAVTAPLSLFGDLRTAYRVIHEQLARALRGVGVDAAVAPPLRRPTLVPGACFDLTIGGEVTAGGRKTIGSAQSLSGTAMLQHGAIARSSRNDALARFRLVSQPGEPDITAAELPPANVLAEAIVAGWLAAGGIPVPASLIDQALRDSNQFAARFQDPDWTWRR